MKIAMIGFDLPPEGRGGVCHVVHRLANSLVERNIGVDVFTTSHKPEDAKYNVFRINLGFFDILPKALKPLLFSLYLSWQDFSTYDLIHSHGDEQFISSNKPVLRTFHGSASGEAIYSRNPLRYMIQLFVVYPLEILASLRASIAVAVSKHTCYQIPFIKRVIHNGVGIEKFRPGTKSQNPSILFVGGKIGGRKRGNSLIKLFSSYILKEIPSAELWIVSSDKVEGKNIKYYSDLTISQLAEIYRQAWVFCLPSAYEGFGIPYIEAMASGTAVISSPNLGAKEIIGRNEWGIISEDDKLGQTIISVLKDKTKRNFFERQGLQRNKDFSFEKMVNEYIMLYKKIRRQGK